MVHNQEMRGYGLRRAVEDVSLTVEPGRTHVLLGSSGSGKSTILRLVLGPVRPDAGEVIVQTDGAPGPPTRRIGYVVQEGALYPHLTAARNVTLPARAAGWAPDRQAARLATLAELVGLEGELLDLHPLQLSGGQRQRVSLMRALMLDPPVLLLDQPLRALEPIGPRPDRPGRHPFAWAPSRSPRATSWPSSSPRSSTAPARRARRAGRASAARASSTARC